MKFAVDEKQNILYFTFVFKTNVLKTEFPGGLRDVRKYLLRRANPKNGTEIVSAAKYLQLAMSVNAELVFVSYNEGLMTLGLQYNDPEILKQHLKAFI